MTAKLAERCRTLPTAAALDDDAPRSASATVREFGKEWTSGKLFAKHGEVRGLGDKKSAGSDATRLKAHVYPFIGDTAVADVTEEDIEHCFAKAAQAAHAKRGKPWRSSTKFQVYQVTKRLFDLAIKPGRLRTDNPVSVDLKPRRDPAKMFAFLYPDELLSMLRCGAIPLGRRIHYVLGCYTGLRKSSLAPLVWTWVDFAHGTMSAIVTKSGVPLMFELQPDVLALLQAWYEHCGSNKLGPVICDLDAPEGREAETLRADLRLAGVTRALLFSDAPNVQCMRFHDTRATFVTWALRAGKGWGWITARTGHVTPAMMERYNRSAQVLSDLQYEPFPDLRDAIPELSMKASNVVRLRRS
ncbi:MAG TPA: tyrosine-type recombinase/integrase [Steroidobacteraceae bacterium]|nr:tyrosine-type recombinase/integrase [Steroidobacteraceae bacterium]